MSNRAFLTLYALCLLVLVGLVQLARVGHASVPPPQKVAFEGAVIAVPPKPDLESRRSEEGEGHGKGTRYDEATCRTYEGDFRDVCFQALARQRAPRDLEGGLLACGEVTRDRLRFECMADVAEMHALTSLPDSLAVCPTIPKKKWADQCTFGISMALVATDPARALANCDGAGMWRDFCRHDVLGETSTRNLDFVLEACGREEGDLLTRKSCWHGIGKYIGRQDLDAAFAACRRVPLGPSGLYRENCVHGAGWAAGERMGSAAVATCEALAENRDSCLLGVAYQIKRVDPDSAVGVCKRAGRSDLATRCLAFVER